MMVQPSPACTVYFAAHEAPPAEVAGAVVAEAAVVVEGTLAADGTHTVWPGVIFVRWVAPFTAYSSRGRTPTRAAMTVQPSPARTW
jgi:hypothetical protein